jgi:hypothetical protein
VDLWQLQASFSFWNVSAKCQAEKKSEKTYKVKGYNVSLAAFSTL